MVFEMISLPVALSAQRKKQKKGQTILSRARLSSRVALIFRVSFVFGALCSPPVSSTITTIRDIPPFSRRRVLSLSLFLRIISAGKRERVTEKNGTKGPMQQRRLALVGGIVSRSREDSNHKSCLSINQLTSFVDYLRARRSFPPD